MARNGASSFIKTIGNWLVYVLFRTVELFIALTPLTLCALIGKAIGLTCFYLFPSYRKLALHNLSIAFGRERDLAWRKQIARKHFLSLGANFFCGLKLPLMSEASVAKRVTCEGMENAAAVARAGKPLIYGICHMSCWELLTQIPSLFSFGQKAASIYQPLGNPFLEAHIKRRREKLGYTLFDRTKGFTAPMKHMREGGGGVGVLVDQHAGDKGVWCPFFDRLASTSNLGALMALRCETVLLPLALYDDGLARWRLVCYPPVNSGEPKPTAEGVTAMMNIAVEHMIRRAPENWFWVHDRWKTPDPDFLLAKYRRGIVLPTGYDIKRLQPFNLIVRSPNWLGDACMALPAIRALKRGRPDMRLTVLAQSNLVELWKLIPEVDNVVLKEKKDSTGKVARRIREAGPFDAAVFFTNSTRSTLEIWRAGVPLRLGYRGSLRSWFLNVILDEPHEDGPPWHHAQRYLHIAKVCGAASEDPSLFATPPISGAGGYKLGICAGAEYGQAKRWPLENFADVANRLSAKWPQIEWALLGAPKEAPMGERLSASLNGRHQNLVGKTSLTELIQQLTQCRLLVTNDTGTMHLAAAIGVPTVSIFGSTEPILTGPLGSKHVIVRNHVACSPCFKRECPFGHYDCMTGVSADRVEAEIIRALSTP